MKKKNKEDKENMIPIILGVTIVGIIIILIALYLNSNPEVLTDLTGDVTGFNSNKQGDLIYQCGKPSEMQDDMFMGAVCYYDEEGISINEGEFITIDEYDNVPINAVCDSLLENYDGEGAAFILPFHTDYMCAFGLKNVK